MFDNVIVNKQDLTYLKWSHVRSSSGTAGTFLKSQSAISGEKIYYKLSGYDSERGIIGHECVNELIVDRLLTILGVEHLNYQLIHADVEIDGKVYDTWLCASKDFKKRGESKAALDSYYQINRDRHGANIEVLRDGRKSSVRIAPLFDHGLSLFCTCYSDEEINCFDVMSDKPCQKCIGISCGICFGKGGANMKSYAIYDEDLDRNTPIGYLFYYEKAQEFIIELCGDLDEWSAPLLFQGLVSKGIYTIPHEAARMWVEERVIPSGRQNIGSILKNHKLQSYNEMALLSLSKGKCAQDQCYIDEIAFEKIPAEIRGRFDKNVSECFPAKDGQLICMFRDNTVRKINLELLKEQYNDVIHVLQNQRLLDSVKPGVGGYSIVFDDTIEVMVDDLRNTGKLLPLSADDFYGFVQRNVVDTTQVCDMMQCSRQNLSYLVKEERITPIISGSKVNLYTRGAVERIMNE